MLSEADRLLLSRNAVAFVSYYSGFRLKDFHCRTLEIADTYPRSVILYFATGGKALALDTPVKTTGGWKTMASLRVGDSVFGPNGHPTPVVAKSPVWRDRPCWDIGGIVADENHEWLARTEDYWGEQVVTTANLHTKRGRRAAIRLAEPLRYDAADLPLHPWLLGFWLGDGHSGSGRITVGDEDWAFVSGKIRGLGYEVRERNPGKAATVSGIVGRLRALGVLRNKHIPAAYMTADVEQRRQLLQGLIDSDGHVDPGLSSSPHPGRVEYCSTSRVLADGVLELVRSLGMRAEMHGGSARLYGRYISEKYRVYFYGEGVASIPRKAAHLRGGRRRRHYVRPVPVRPRDTQCIQVAGGMFLAGERLIPTRNSSLLSLWYPVFKIAQNRNVRIIIGFKNDEEKKTYARAIRHILSSNVRLREDFGRFQPRGKDAVWSNDSIEVEGREISEPQPTILFVSSNSIDQALGRRCDLFIMDDIVTPTTVSTQAQRDKQATLFNEGVETSPQYIWDRDPDSGRLLVPDGITWPHDIAYEKGIITGTVFHPDDLFHRKVGNVGQMESGKLYTKVHDPKYVAIRFDIWRDEAKREPMWPERWTAEKIDLERKSKGDISFNRRYRNIAVDEGSMVFRRPWIYGGEDGPVTYAGCLDRTRSFGDLPNDPYTVMGVDPSTGRKGRGTTFSAFVIAAVTRNEHPRKLYIVDLLHKQMGFDDIISYATTGDEARGIPGFFSLYKFNEGRIEANSAQRYLIDNDRMRAAAFHGCRVLPHETQVGNRNDPISGVSSMQRMFMDSQVSIPYRNPSDREKAAEFIDQLLAFPEGLYDYAMALWFCVIAVRALGGRYKASGPLRGDVIRSSRSFH